MELHREKKTEEMKVYVKMAKDEENHPAVQMLGQTADSVQDFSSKSLVSHGTKVIETEL